MKKISIILLFAALMVSTVLFTAQAEDTAEFPDMPDDWSTPALQAAVANGIISGNDGLLLPNNNLTRAEMATILTRVFGAVNKGDISSFSDVSPEAWYHDYIAKAYQMGIFRGDGIYMNPENPITREEAFTVLARAFALSVDSIETVNQFPDAGDVSSWALDSVAALIENHYIQGSNGVLNPKAQITRAEFAQIMFNLVKTYIAEDSLLPVTLEGNVVVRGNVTLNNITVNGDMIIGDGVDQGVVLKNASVSGRLVARGGNGTKLDGGVFESVVLAMPEIVFTFTSGTTIHNTEIIGQNSKIEQESANTSGGNTSGGNTSGGNSSGGNTSGGNNSGGNSSGGNNSGGDDNGGDDNGGDDNGGDDNGGIEEKDDDGDWTGWY